MREKKEKAPKVKKIKNPGKKFKISSLVMSILALILTLGVFSGLVFLQNYLSDEIVYQTVVVAKKDIPEGLIITEENKEEYLSTKQINVLEISKGSVTDFSTLVNLKAKIFLYAGEQVALKDFDNLNEYIDDLKEPVEISVAIGNIADAAGGKIRSGDLVNITMRFTEHQLEMDELSQVSTSDYMEYTNSDDSENTVEEDSETETETETETENDSETDETEEDSEPDTDTSEVVKAVDDETAEEESKESISTIVYPENQPESETSKKTYKTSKYKFEGYAQYVYENLYVTKVLDSSGAEIDPTNTTSNASVLVFMIEKSDELEFINAITNGSSIKVSRVIKKESQPVTEKTEEKAEEKK